MAFVALTVAGLFERPEHEIAENPLFRLAGNFSNETLVMARGNAEIFARQDYVFPRFTSVPPLLGNRKTLDGNRADTERIAEVSSDLLEIHDAFGFGHFVDAIQAWNLGALEFARDGFVRRQHEFFNDAMR